MASLDVMSIVMFILRIVPAIIFVLLIVLLFFSFRVELKEDSMQRFTTELADSLASSPLTLHRSVFDPQALTEAEKLGIELYAQNCDFGYNIEVTSLAGRTTCSSNSDCSGFCNSVCGLPGSDTSNCDCNFELFGSNFCECRKNANADWQDTYDWKYGYTPVPAHNIREVRSEFPAGIGVGDSAIPATLKISVYDSTLTRLTCITAKAHELKEKHTIIFATRQNYFNTFRRTDPQGTHACLYSDFGPLECRYFPAVNFESFRLQGAQFSVTAYPLKQIATCGEIKSNPSVIAGENDNVATVVLCAESL